MIRNLNYTQEISSCLLIVYVIYINMNRTRLFHCHYFVFSFNARFLFSSKIMLMT